VPSSREDPEIMPPITSVAGASGDHSDGIATTQLGVKRIR